MRHIITISGKDSLCAAIVQKARDESLPYEYIFCDVRMELPETYEWLKSVEDSLGIRLIRVGKSLEDVIKEQGFLPSQNRRFCTKYGKIFPMQNFVGRDQATQYFGIRFDEFDRSVSMAMPNNICAKFPLIDNRIDLPAVYDILERKQLLPPAFHWQRLYDLVWQAADDATRNRINNLRTWEKASLFSWRSRSNCFMCFYQRQYEWVGLLEHHPELFVKAMNIEQEYARIGSRQLNPFYFHEGYPLSWIMSNRVKILKKRAVAVLKSLVGSGTETTFDMLAATSCGVYCGK